MNIIADIIHIAARHPHARHRDREPPNLYIGHFDEHAHYRHENHANVDCAARKYGAITASNSDLRRTELN